jgi:hypothetical protein
MPFFELYNAGRTADYPFGYLQVKLNDKGEGSGQIMVAAKIRFNRKKGPAEHGSGKFREPGRLPTVELKVSD